jgi:hypothetical protein
VAGGKLKKLSALSFAEHVSHSASERSPKTDRLELIAEG